MHKPEFVLEDAMHKILRDLEMQRDPLVPSRRPDKDCKPNKKKTNPAVLGILPSRRTKESKLKKAERQILEPCQRTNKAVKDEGDGDTNGN